MDSIRFKNKLKDQEFTKNKNQQTQKNQFQFQRFFNSKLNINDINIDLNQKIQIIIEKTFVFLSNKGFIFSVFKKKKKNNLRLMKMVNHFEKEI